MDSNTVMAEENVRCMFEARYFLKAWKEARVVVLLKSPDKVRTAPGSYRPICLLSVLVKVLERMMVRRLKRKIGDAMCDAQHEEWQINQVCVE